MCGDVAISDGSQKVVHTLVLEELGELFKGRLLQPQTMQFLIKHLSALGNVLSTFLPPEPLPGLGTCPRGIDIPCLRVQPISAGTTPLCRQNPYLFARVQLVIERHEAAIHLCAATTVAYLCMDIVGKVNRRSPAGQIHDVSLGGLFVALVESALPGGLGFDVTSPAEIRGDAFLFGESQSRVVVSVTAEQETQFLDFMMETGIHFSALGHVTKEELRIDDISFGFISDYARDFENALEHLLGD